MLSIYCGPATVLLKSKIKRVIYFFQTPPIKLKISLQKVGNH
jgi:hypothetical protein